MWRSPPTRRRAATLGLLAIVTRIRASPCWAPFLVRSGVLTSVHAFAVDPDRGLFILVLLVIAVGGSLALFRLAGPPALKGGGLFAPVSREGALVLNNLLLTTAALTVFVGTLYPLFSWTRWARGRCRSDPSPTSNATFGPLMVPLVRRHGDRTDAVLERARTWPAHWAGSSWRHCSRS